MKKILLATAFVMMMVFSASAQRGGTDGFFSDYNNNLRETGDAFNDINQTMPSGHGLLTDSVPVGSGLLILTALGAGYAVARKRKN